MRRVVLAVLFSLFLLLPTQAQGITRSEVMDRADEWVKDRVPYSQQRYHEGYRTDCSGFVSMAWKANSSYTTRSFMDVSHRIKRSELKRGDAVLIPGVHIVLFDKWVGKGKREFLALEEPSSGHVARRKVKRVRDGMVFIRGDKVKDDPVPEPVMSSTELRLMHMEARELREATPSITLDPKLVFRDPILRLMDPSPLF